MDRTHPIFHAGMTRRRAMEQFVAHSNQGPDVLFPTEHWFLTHHERVRAQLPDLLDEDHAQALDDLLHKRKRARTFLTWLDHRPWPWYAVDTLVTRLERGSLLEARERGFFPWTDVDACRGASSPSHFSSARPRPHGDDTLEGCHGCGRPATQLEWLCFSSPGWTWRRLCGRAGWMGICADCRYQIHFFMDVLS
jgi:hypothetical protein